MPQKGLRRVYAGKPSVAKQILDYLKGTTWGQMRATVIAEAIGKDYSDVCNALSEMEREGLIDKRRDGRMVIYGLKTKGK